MEVSDEIIHVGKPGLLRHLIKRKPQQQQFFCFFNAQIQQILYRRLVIYCRKHPAEAPRSHAARLCHLSNCQRLGITRFDHPLSGQRAVISARVNIPVHAFSQKIRKQRKQPGFCVHPVSGPHPLPALG